MPVEYQIDHGQRLVQAKAYGVVTVQDFIAYQREVWSRKDVVGYDELIDATQAQEAIDFTEAHLKDVAILASTMDSEKNNTKLAIVASKDFYYGLGRMYESYRDLQIGSAKQVSVFRSIKDALEWIHEIQLKDGKTKNS